MTSVVISCKRDKNKYTVKVSGGDNVDRALAKALFGLYILSSPVGMPKKTFSYFLHEKLGGMTFSKWLNKFPSLKNRYDLMSKVTNNKIELEINASGCENPPKAISALLLPPVSLEDVILAYMYAKMTGDSAAFEAWSSEVVERAKLYALESGVDLSIT